MNESFLDWKMEPPCVVEVSSNMIMENYYQRCTVTDFVYTSNTLEAKNRETPILAFNSASIGQYNTILLLIWQLPF